jgi:hypothetical protein
MERLAETAASHRLSARHLGDGGPSYAPVYLTEYGTALSWAGCERRALSRGARWLVRAALVALVVCGAHFGSNAKTPRIKPAPVEISAGLSGFSAVGGREVNRW